jgi:cytochrome c oxidase accessory protein FixG
MWIEERVEGSRNQRIKLDKVDNSPVKLRKKILKHTLWLFVAFATGLTFVGYFYPIRELVPDLLTLSIVDGWAYFWIGFFTVATYANAGWMREQVCLYMCPYARFQSVMFDKDTLIVSYNPTRGEPRGSRKKGSIPAEENLGDCIDCEMCVQVCPTGIDIRDGLQYECIGCALCIDACDQIMDKMNYPKGLISYTTEMNLEGKESKLLRPKAIGYFALLMIMIGAVIYSISNRIPLQLDVLRDRGSLYQTNAIGFVENGYTLKIVNMLDTPREFTIAIDGLEGASITTRTTIKIGGGEVASIPTVVEIDPKKLNATNVDLRFVVTASDDNNITDKAESRFLGPPTYRR